MHKQAAPKTALLMTGNELMSGDILDSNYLGIAKTLIEIGIEVQEKVTVGDNVSLLVEQIKRLSDSYELIIINGGLGPTSDDLTAEAIALAFNEQLVINDDAKKHIEQWCKKRGAELTESNLKQAKLPDSAEIFPEPPGSAPAFYTDLKRTLVIATPGVPFELDHIMACNIVDFLQRYFNLSVHNKWQIMTLFGIGESPLQELINQSNIPKKDLVFGYRAYLPYIEFKYLIKQNVSHEERHAIQKAIMSLIDPFYVGLGKTDIAQALSHILAKKALTLSAAESCTGGLIAHYMTKHAGASSVFEGGAVTYSNRLKESCLNVCDSTLSKHGAVSKETALEMHTGILELTHTDYAIAVTGVAGPDGGTESKPVGTVYIAWGTKQSPYVMRFMINMPRYAFQKIVATIALDLVRFDIVEQSVPHYISRWQVKE